MVPCPKAPATKLCPVCCACKNYAIYVVNTHTIHVWYVYLPTYIWLIVMLNVGKYTIHGWYGICRLLTSMSKCIDRDAKSGNGGMHCCLNPWEPYGKLEQCWTQILSSVSGFLVFLLITQANLYEVPTYQFNFMETSP